MLTLTTCLPRLPPRRLPSPLPTGLGTGGIVRLAPVYLISDFWLIPILADTAFALVLAVGELGLLVVSRKGKEWRDAARAPEGQHTGKSEKVGMGTGRCDRLWRK